MAVQQLQRIDERGRGIAYLFTQNQKALVGSAPKGAAHGDPNRLIRIAYNAIATDEKLLQCTHVSILGGVMEALKLGLTLGGPMQEAWLIPFMNNKKNVLEATFIVGYQGYRNIIDRAKSTLDLHPRVVYANDEFDFQFGDRPFIHHRPHWFVGRPQRGELVAVYAVAHLRGGGLQMEILPKSEVDEHRNRSRAKNNGPWVTDYDSMALKTSLRKIAKYLPKSSDLLARALALDDKADRGDAQDLELPEGAQVFDESMEKPVGGSKLDELKKTMQGTASLAPASGAEITDKDIPFGS